MRISSFIVGLLLVLAGVIAFMNNIGLGSWELVREAFKFWPVVLIVIGFSLFWDGRIPRWLALILVLLVSAGVVFLGLSTPYTQDFQGARKYFGGQTHFSVESQEYPDLTGGELNVKFGGGSLHVNPAAEGWFRGVFSGPQRVVPVQESEQTRLKVDLVQDGSRINLGGGSNRWDLDLSPGIPWTVSLDIGAVSGRLNLYGIPLDHLDLQFGAGDVDLQLGENGEEASVVISSGASNLKVRVPEDVGLRIEVKGALARTNIQEHNFPVIDERYTSPHYEEADSRIDMKVDMAVGNFELERYER